ncbi:MAG: hypothetical protein IKP31_00370, partial [Lachnospiraceae bacterium]|nr:hypothetical protein [Lachnospiraceae bacterium]
TGDRSFTFARKPGADMFLNEDDVKKVDFLEWDIVHVGSVSQSGTPERDAVLSALEGAVKNHKLVSFDINYRDKIWSVDECRRESEKIYPYTDLLKISEEELVFTGGEDNIPAFMKEHDITVVVLTRGGNGARIFLRETQGEESVVSTDIASLKADKIVDTTGAGDAYWGSFLSCLLRQGIKDVSDITMDKLVTAGRYGAVSGGLCIQKSGGIPALPVRDEIEAVLDSYDDCLE